MYYKLSIKSTPPGIVDTIELTTAVRKRLSYHLLIVNPLPSPVTFSTSTDVTDISLPLNFIVGGQSEVRGVEILELGHENEVGGRKNNVGARKMGDKKNGVRGQENGGQEKWSEGAGKME